jgi:hypothetical protein
MFSDDVAQVQALHKDYGTVNVAQTKSEELRGMIHDLLADNLLIL